MSHTNRCARPIWSPVWISTNENISLSVKSKFIITWRIVGEALRYQRLVSRHSCRVSDRSDKSVWQDKIWNGTHLQYGKDSSLLQILIWSLIFSSFAKVPFPTIKITHTGTTSSNLVLTCTYDLPTANNQFKFTWLLDNEELDGKQDFIISSSDHSCQLAFNEPLKSHQIGLYSCVVTYTSDDYNYVTSRNVSYYVHDNCTLS